MVATRFFQLASQFLTHRREFVKDRRRKRYEEIAENSHNRPRTNLVAWGEAVYESKPSVKTAGLGPPGALQTNGGSMPDSRT
jgi:hypothetical protein